MQELIVQNIIQLVFTIAVAILTYFLGKGKEDAEITKLLTDAATALVKPLNERIGALEEQIKSLELQQTKLLDAKNKAQAEIKKLQNKDVTNQRVIKNMRKKYNELLGGVGLLVAQIIKAGLTPDYIPPVEEDKEL